MSFTASQKTTIKTDSMGKKAPLAGALCNNKVCQQKAKVNKTTTTLLPTTNVIEFQEVLKGEKLDKLKSQMEELRNNMKTRLQKFNSRLDQFDRQQDDLIDDIDYLTKISNYLAKLRNEKQNLTSKLSTLKKHCFDLSSDVKTVTLNGNKYHFPTNISTMSWSKAVIFCKSLGMDLIAVETREEWEALIPEVRAYGKAGMPWSDGIFDTEDGEWKWSSTKSDITFFAPKILNPYFTKARCLLIAFDSWTPYMCDFPQLPMCEVNTEC